MSLALEMKMFAGESGLFKKSQTNEGTNIKGYPALPRVNGTSGNFGMQKISHVN